MSWDGLLVGARWPKCGHPKTPENTLQNGYARCRECHRQFVGDWWERQRYKAQEEAAETLALDPLPAELGPEFMRARQRWAVGQTRLRKKSRVIECR